MSVHELVFCQKCGGGRECEVTERTECGDEVRLKAVCPVCCSLNERVVSRIGGVLSLGATSLRSHRMRVYVAGPYTAGSEEAVMRNVESAIRAGITVYEKGHFPYVPHLTYYLEKAGLVLPHAGWLEFDRPWLMSCDAIFVTAPSPGADQEREWAERGGLRVYTDAEEIPSAEEMAELGIVRHKLSDPQKDGCERDG